MAIALATMNKSFKRAGKGSLYLMAHPTVTPGSGTLKSAMLGYLTAIDALAAPFAETDDGGIEYNITTEMNKYSTQDDKDVDLSVKNTSISGKLKIFDADPGHWANMLGSTSAELLTDPAATGKAGKTLLGIGGSLYPVEYTIAWKMPSKPFQGSFDYFVFTDATFAVKTTGKLNNAGAQMIELEFNCKSDPWLLNIDTNIYEKAFIAYADVAPLP